MSGSIFPNPPSALFPIADPPSSLPHPGMPGADFESLAPWKIGEGLKERPGELILVVEDNTVLCHGIQLLLEAEGFRVLTAGNGLEALEQMQIATPDLILCDIAMPKMDGYELFEAVRDRPEWVPIPFIFLTARGGREDIFNGKKLGADDYLVKPVNAQDVVTTIRSRLARSHQLLYAQLQQAYESSLVMLSNAIELRDAYTRGHVQRVRDYSIALAQAMGFNQAQMVFLKLGSILHDIGKIYIPESILKKPGSLDDAEWEEMKRHPVLGAELINNIPYLAPAMPMIRHHHERWDGRGYPDGLQGADIPQGARIIAVADSLDAMTTARPYQERCTPEQALEEIEKGSGSQYDPQVVQALRAAWNEILAVRD